MKQKMKKIYNYNNNKGLPRRLNFKTCKMMMILIINKLNFSEDFVIKNSRN